MSYTPINWQTGDTITAEKLNNMEQGIASAGGGTAIVGTTFDLDSGKTTCNKTAAEIAELFASSGSVALGEISAEDSYYSLRNVVTFEYDNSDHEDFYFIMIVVSLNGSFVTFTANSASDYPYTTSQM